MEEVIENNKLIAEFMEIEVDHDMVWLSEKLHMDLIKGRDYLEWAETKNVDNTTYVCVHIDYDWNWNWLMTVSQKIDKYFDDNLGEIAYLDDCLLSNDIDVRYQAVVEFIEWYNSGGKYTYN